jgi:hypothetical protein
MDNYNDVVMRYLNRNRKKMTMSRRMACPKTMRMGSIGFSVMKY